MHTRNDIKYLNWIVSTYGLNILTNYHKRRSCKNMIMQENIKQTHDYVCNMGDFYETQEQQDIEEQEV